MIVYDPSKLLKEIAPVSKIKRMLKGNVTLKKSALSFVDSVDFIDKKSVGEVALKVAKNYRARIADAEYGEKTALEADILDAPKLLIQRVQNEVIQQISQEIKFNYDSEEYEWLPSSADIPDPEHQLNYGKIFTVGDGEQPGDRYGCQCGMRILVKESELRLG